MPHNRRKNRSPKKQSDIPLIDWSETFFHASSSITKLGEPLRKLGESMKSGLVTGLDQEVEEVKRIFDEYRSRRFTKYDGEFASEPEKQDGGKNVSRKSVLDYWKAYSQNWAHTQKVFRDLLESDPLITQVKQVFVDSQPLPDQHYDRLIMLVMLVLYNELREAQKESKNPSKAMKLLNDSMSEGDSLLPGMLNSVMKQLKQWKTIARDNPEMDNLQLLNQLHEEISDTLETLSEMLKLFEGRKKDATKLQAVSNDSGNLAGGTGGSSEPPPVGQDHQSGVDRKVAEVVYDGDWHSGGPT